MRMLCRLFYRRSDTDAWSWLWSHISNQLLRKWIISQLQQHCDMCIIYVFANCFIFPQKALLRSISHISELLSIWRPCWPFQLLYRATVMLVTNTKEDIFVMAAVRAAIQPVLSQILGTAVIYTRPCVWYNISSHSVITQAPHPPSLTSLCLASVRCISS